MEEHLDDELFRYKCAKFCNAYKFAWNNYANKCLPALSYDWTWLVISIMYATSWSSGVAAGGQGGATASHSTFWVPFVRNSEANWQSN